MPMKEMHLEKLCVKWMPFCFTHNVLNNADHLKEFSCYVNKHPHLSGILIKKFKHFIMPVQGYDTIYGTTISKLGFAGSV